jgi:hypothetical protein
MYHPLKALQNKHKLSLNQEIINIKLTMNF